MNKKRLTGSVIEILMGTVLAACAFAGFLDEYWSGMGGALIGVGVIQLVRCVRYRSDEGYRENVDTQANDERNQYLSMKAWSWAGYFFVIIAAVASIVLKILGLDEYMMIASGSVCLLIMLYWLSWLYLRKKY